jgi:hypothetical protein
VGSAADGQRVAWSSVPQIQANQLTRLEYQLQLPVGGQPLGRPQPISEGNAFLRARTTYGDYTLSHRAGGN